MAVARKLRIYLNDGQMQDVRARKQNFFNILTDTFQAQGFHVEIRENTAIERLKSADREGYSLFHMETPNHDRALDLRVAYAKPFWRIERHQWREEYEVARARFRTDGMDMAEARRFYAYWQKQLTPNYRAVEDGHVLVALQGKLLEKRHGQSMSPIDMIRTVMAHEPSRHIVIRPHPKERYSDEDLDALGEFERDTRVSIERGALGNLLNGCAYTVSQNSGVSFEGLLFRKPGILFGASDFHHVFENVNKTGAERAFGEVLRKNRAFEAYLYWFWQLNCINAGREDAGEKILASCRRHGWDV